MRLSVSLSPGWMLAVALLLIAITLPLAGRAGWVPGSGAEAGAPALQITSTKTPTFSPTATFTPAPIGTSTPTPSATHSAVTSSPTPTQSSIPTKTPTPTAAPSTLYLPMARRDPAPPSCLVSELEPNDSSTQARGQPPLCLGEWLDGALPAGDPDDFYRVEITLSDLYLIDLTALPSGTDFDLFLYDNDLKLLAESRNFDQQPEEIRQSLAPGTYFVRVFPFFGESSTPYALRMMAAPRP